MSSLDSGKAQRFSYLSPGSDSAGSEEFLKFCDELGYVHQLVDMDSGIWPADVPVVYIEKNASPGREKLERYMRRHQGVAALGVLEPGAELDLSMAKRYCDVITWPCSRDELNFRLHKICAPAHQEHDELTQELLWRCNLIGESAEFLHCIDELRRLAECDAHIILRGETGTGKELAARAVHYSSARRDGPFIPVNCGALPDSLLEDELFGHERGAYTDAKQRRRGLVAQAHGGTLFLDEVDSLSLPAQSSLLRFVQDGTFRILGSEKESRAELRIVAATNKNLEELAERGLFREDLRYRLEVFTCTLPPLRQRAGDPVVLARYFARQFCAHYDQDQRPLHPAMEAWVASHPWPGNVRELENEIHRAVVLSAGENFIGGKSVNADEPGQKDKAPPRFQKAKERVIREFEFNYLSDLIKRSDGNVTKAARMAGKERRAFGKLLKKHGIVYRRGTHQPSSRRFVS